MNVGLKEKQTIFEILSHKYLVHKTLVTWTYQYQTAHIFFIYVVNSVKVVINDQQCESHAIEDEINCFYIPRIAITIL